MKIEIIVENFFEKSLNKKFLVSLDYFKSCAGDLNSELYGEKIDTFNKMSDFEILTKIRTKEDIFINLVIIEIKRRLSKEKSSEYGYSLAA